MGQFEARAANFVSICFQVLKLKLRSAPAVKICKLLWKTHHYYRLSLSLSLSLPFPLSLSVIHTLMHLNTNTLHVLKNTISLLSLYRIPTQMHTDNYARTPTLTHVYLECKMPG